MVATSDTFYSAALRRADQARGTHDGEQGIPALAEVRRRQAELAGTGETVTVGYQLVLLAELHEKLDHLHAQFLQMGRAAAIELDRCDERIERAREDVVRWEQRVEAARLPLTPEELLPRNREEQRWSDAMLRHRREVARSRRIMRAQEELEHARDQVDRRRAERVAAVRQHQAAASGPGTRARGLVELYQRRLAEYLAALARAHPHGRTLSPLLTLPPVALPTWVLETSSPSADTGSSL
ncbi:hypothetical protein GA0074696_0244 [Micromonospora purpureochromogenes]|uniref:Uncharacterized protein n=1 Tax=Micromonospora purpureochromogenes TaxID=47872 RepID=A0A1C4UB44_9ACTN|nr:hypothetical protein [Micromonospora purpureochromogenes]SCE68920.1 hypothetical protein GA0074696_0244 [Micromonospora purpureochromogenes]